MSVMYNCSDVGDNFVNIKITDASGNVSTCIGHVKIIDYLDGIFINLAPPELCLEANNQSQLNFANYLTITLPNGQHVQHADVPTNSYTQGSQGYFFITAFLPDSTSSDDPGSISYDGVYTPGTGSGFVTLSYLLLPPGYVPPADSNPPFRGCFEIRHVVFELRQPLDMDSPECMCVQERERVVDLGIVRGGLEPYRIQYSGTPSMLTATDLLMIMMAFTPTMGYMATIPTTLSKIWANCVWNTPSLSGPSPSWMPAVAKSSAPAPATTMTC
jgi:hypothetical protein